MHAWVAIGRRTWPWRRLQFTIQISWALPPAAAGMFTDPSFQQPARVDKRGRKVNSQLQHNPLHASGSPRVRWWDEGGFTVPVQVKAGKVQNDIKAFYRLQDQVCSLAR